MVRTKPRGLVAAFSILGLMFLSSPAAAETGKLNIHLEPGAVFPLTGWQANELGVGLSLGLKLELPIVAWFGVQAGGSYVQFFEGGHPPGYEPIDAAYFYNGSLGVRFRILNDEKGYLYPWVKTPAHAGNLWGNLWVDLHADYYYTGDLNRFGADVGVGYEFSLVNGLQVGPCARVLYIYQPDNKNQRNSEDGWMLVAGLSVSVAIPPAGQILGDADSDNIFDRDDTCPDQPEDHDGYQDEDGCPDEDNDKDQILDLDDACPLTPEDADGVEDGDGCPDKDNDNDKIPDSRDACPDKPEDKDNFEDEDGCPEEDNDQDGILDESDSCPDEAETINKLEDEDGCPEEDKDADGFPDTIDQCPEKPETVNGVKDDDGCPDKGLVEVQKDRILLGQRVFFDRDMSRIKSRSRRMLKELANLIKTHPEYILISIEGHADKKGNREYNLKLSKKRAGRVRDYLIDLGIRPDRLIFKGYGESSPLIHATSDEETYRNRRVELLIESIDEKLALTPVAPQTKHAVTKTQQAKDLQDFSNRLKGIANDEPPPPSEKSPPEDKKEQPSKKIANGSDADQKVEKPSKKKTEIDSGKKEDPQKPKVEPGKAPKAPNPKLEEQPYD